MFTPRRPRISSPVCLVALAAMLPRLLAAQAAPSGEGFVDAGDGVLLHYRAMGTGPDTVVVLHGGPGLVAAYLAPDLQPLADSRTLLFYDRRGEGRSTLVSDSARITMEAHVADLEAVRRYFGIERITVLAHSFGSLIGARYARAHPDRVAKLVMVGPAPPRARPYNELFSRHIMAWMDSATLAELDRLDAAQRDTAGDVVAACRAFFRLLFRGYLANPRDTSVFLHMRGDFCAAPPAAIRNQLVIGDYTWASFADWDWRDDFHQVHVPVIIVAGTREPLPVESFREWEAAFPEARLVFIEGAGHFPYLEKPARFFATVERALR